MIQAFVLCHPQSGDLLGRPAYETGLARLRRVACGTTRVEGADLSEAADFCPTYASWNSALFETSVILTLWEHMAELVGDDDVAIVHSDVELHFGAEETWRKIGSWLAEAPLRSVGLTAPASAAGIWDDWEIPVEVPYVPARDPMMLHPFDHGVRVWELIRRYDPEIHAWAMDTKPKLIYSHQFACTRGVFDRLGESLYGVAQRMRMRDVGLWTPHVFERLIALYLAREAPPLLSTCFWHYSSSGAFGPGELSLYGPRPRRYYKITTRWNSREVAQAEAPRPVFQARPGP